MTTLCIIYSLKAHTQDHPNGCASKPQCSLVYKGPPLSKGPVYYCTLCIYLHRKLRCVLAFQYIPYSLLSLISPRPTVRSTGQPLVKYTFFSSFKPVLKLPVFPPSSAFCLDEPIPAPLLVISLDDVAQFIDLTFSLRGAKCLQDFKYLGQHC
jgi:hypothetical protein